MAYKILVVDDESHYADMLRDLLLQSNFIADMVTSAQQALDALDTEEYALIIADFKMPGMDGAEFLQRVRQRSLTLPFFMVSGLMNTHELIRVANLGVTLVFEKPLEITDFMECVKRYVSPLSETEFQKRFRGDVTGENYPSEIVHLSDRSPLSHAFVERLWSTFKRERVAVVPVLPGAEIELLAREISRWKGRSQGEFYTLTPEIIADPASVEALNAVALDHSVSTVLIVNGLEEAADEHLGIMAEFIRGRHTLPALHQELFFLVLPDATANGAALAARHPTLGAAIKAKRIPLPPLRERPSDIARYTRTLLAAYAQETGDPSKVWLTPETVGLILQHPWRGEYAELTAKLREAVTMERPTPLVPEDLAKILAGEGPPPESGYTLGRRLLHAQDLCLEAGLEANGGDPLSALLAIGIPSDIAENIRPGELAFPELLK